MRAGGAFVLSCILAACGAWSLAPGAARAQSQSPFSSSTLIGRGNGQMLLKADRVDYDLNTGVATAIGDVEIDYNGRILLADRVVNDQNHDIVTASGHVVMMAPNGSVVFAEQVRLTDRMKNGAMESFAALFGQNGRL